MSGAVHAYRGQKGDAPQAAALIEGLPAEVVMADTAYDANHCAKPSPPRERSPSSPTTRHARSSIRSTRTSMPNAISSNAASQSSSSSGASQPVSKKPREIIGPSSPSQQSSYGYDKCPHDLERDDFLQIVITFGTNALYGRSVDFVNTWGSAAVWVS